MDRGDIYDVSLDPTRGHEQQGRRRVLVLSKAEFNAISPPIVAAITGGGALARYAGLTVSLAATGLATHGVVLCNQIRALDIGRRAGRHIETAPDYIIDDVLAKVAAILE